MKETLLLGAHTSTSGGLANALLEGAEIGATTVQIFTANQRRWESAPLQEGVIAKWHEELEKLQMRKIMSHASYLINLGAPDPLNLEKSRICFQTEVDRCHQLDISFVNVHPGASITEPTEQCLNRIVESLLLLQPSLAKGKTTVLLETTAGQGSTVGRSFEELGYIIEQVKGKIPIGVCIDTCHIFAAGYDIRTPSDWDKVLALFDKLIGLCFLQAFHLNDSLHDLGSKKDRHQPLGEGKIGMESFAYLMKQSALQQVPKYLETPGGPPRWKEEILQLRRFSTKSESDSE